MRTAINISAWKLFKKKIYDLMQFLYPVSVPKISNRSSIIPFNILQKKHTNAHSSNKNFANKSQFSIKKFPIIQTKQTNVGKIALKTKQTNVGKIALKRMASGSF